jgi:predicted RND superfamily exporter protein
MSRRSFFGKRLPFFGNRAMLILCAVFFVLPFLLRGARESVDNIKNDVSDWLPGTFKETEELKVFRDYFLGDQFVVVSWQVCNERDDRFARVLDKLKRESLAGADEERQRLEAMDPATEEYQRRKEELEAKEWATDLGLHTTGNYFEDWGQHNEKWLLGKNKQWYFVRQDGSIFKWNGRNNLIDATGRVLQRFFQGKNEADGTFIKRFGKPDDNRFYRHPELLHARFFTDITTGPDIFERMAGTDGTMIRGEHEDDEKEALEARIETHKRLTGVLFGPTPDPEFDWTLNSFLQVLPEEERAQIDKPREYEFQAFVDGLVREQYGGDIARLRNAPQSYKLEHWYRLFNKLEVDPPPRQTCLVVTLNEPVLDELARAVGRPVLGKPRGRILEIATGLCGIDANNLHIGGPPVDNVAIDEEGSITLFRLVSLSAFIGITLAYLSFRSIRVTMMLFFVGGVAALGSVAIVWFLGGTMDAILMTMPSLVYVLGLSGAVHVVNYYRDACKEKGEGRAADIAVKHGLFPCTLAAFTTALGLISLCTSNLTPINKFGFFSAIATVATVVLLFTYLPSSLTIWPPGYGKRKPEEEESGKRRFSLTQYVEHFWDRVGQWVVAHHAVVSIAGVLLLIAFAFGVARIETSVQLLKLFRSDAKILRDYRWMEENLGKLVPMELMIKVDADAQIAPEENQQLTSEQLDFKLSFLQRMELSDRIRRYVLQVFGDESRDENRRFIGNVMSADLAVPLNRVIGTQQKGPSRVSANGELWHNRDALREQDYFRIDKESHEEFWRISLRLAALNNVDYGQFVGELKTVVEPCLSAYRYRLEILDRIHQKYDEESRHLRGDLLVIGPAPAPPARPGEAEPVIGLTEDNRVNQTGIFVNTLYDLIQNSGFRPKKSPTEGRRIVWRDPARWRDRPVEDQPSEESWIKLLSEFDCVVVIGDPHVSLDLLNQHPDLILADDYEYRINPDTKLALPGMQTASERKESGEVKALITTSYTGIVPIVYKAQRSLLHSLIKSICLAFVMIALLMMILLRPWGSPLTPGNCLNFRAGMVAMVPNVFPIMIVFGAMGHLGRLVDIGSMMTASVAMGVAVDDTIHFLNWFRQGIARGLDRLSAIREAYSRVATAMTQTTLIGGLGLSAFAFSTFMPTQRFGILMLLLLVAALIGDLILLPAILAGPLGKYFCNLEPRKTAADLQEHLNDDGEEVEYAAEVAVQRSLVPGSGPRMIKFKDSRTSAESSAEKPSTGTG